MKSFEPGSIRVPSSQCEAATPRAVQTARWLALIVLAASLGASSAEATPIQLTFSGSVSQINDPDGLNPGISLGDSASGTLVYESTVSGSGVVGGAPYGFSFDFNGFTNSSTTVVHAITDGGCPLGGGDCVQLGLSGNGLTFLDPSGSILSGTAMPSTAVLQSFPSIYVKFVFGGNSSDYALATVSSLSFDPVPEPSSAILLALGLVGMAARGKLRPRGH